MRKHSNIGKTIEFLRLENGLTQKQFGVLLGVSNQTVSKWELGETIPDTDSTIKIAQLFNINIEELIDSRFSDTRQQENRNLHFTISKLNTKLIILFFALVTFVFSFNKLGLFSDLLPILNKISLDIILLIFLFSLIRTVIKYIERYRNINDKFHDRITKKIIK